MTNTTMGFRRNITQWLFVAVLMAMLSILTAPGISRAETSTAQPEISSELLQKQAEIDAYLFDENREEITKQGIQVTSTAAVENVVEIAIQDYTDEKAQYLYNIFGAELVKVVDGQQVELLDGTMHTTTAVDNETTGKADNSGQTTAWVVAGIVLLLGVITVFSRKLRSSKK